ncbi:MAG: FAD-binding oxidoreductase, partial [Minwuiales bacterium]|nr:FAD-binding oxidoreductase [Minwuiales bacterium]
MIDTSLPPSLWADTAMPTEGHPALEGDAETDVAIVGGGFTGLSAALHLTARGVKPLVLEAAEAGWGASGRNGGQVIPGLKYDPRELERMFGTETGGRIAEAAGSAADLVFDLIAKHAIDCDAAQTGWIQPAHAKAHLKDVHARVEDWKRRGAPVDILDRDQTAALVGTDVYAGGWIDRRAGTVQPLSYARGLARAAASNGAVIHALTKVTGLTRVGDRWRLDTPKGSVTARAV